MIAHLNSFFYRMEMLRIDLVEERQKWQHAYQSLALACETRDSGVSSPVSISTDPGERDRDSNLNLSSEELIVGDSIAQVNHIPGSVTMVPHTYIDCVYSWVMLKVSLKR